MNTQAAAPPLSTKVKPCANCGAPMHGPYCYACGQPEKGMIRHLTSVLADVGDTLFNVDSRIFRSIPPLYFRPGFLTLEYFAGRRTRYVTPFRLFFFLCIIAFFAIQFSLNITGSGINLVGGKDDSGPNSAMSEAEVQQRLQKALARIDKAQSAPLLPQEAKIRLDKARQDLQRQADERLAWLQAREVAKASGAPPPPDPHDDGLGGLDGLIADPDRQPIAISWLPQFGNSKLNEAVGRARENLIAAKRDPGHLIAGVFSVLPQTLFVLMPLFALLLKFSYVFKRRLYMEHLMVALHSHAFICLSLLLLALIQLLLGWSSDSVPWVASLLRLVRAAIWIWLPIHLFLMQKRVYRQGWIMTTLKFGFVGICYLLMLGFGLAGALVVSLAIT